MSQHGPDQELSADQTSFASRAGSTLSTPRSLRPGTVPHLDLSPAIALHMASLEGDAEEEEPAHHRQEEQEEGASQRQAVAMASFDDLSGPDDSDAVSEAASVAPSTTASMTHAGQSVQGMEGMLDEADDLPTASSAHCDMPAAHTLKLPIASTAHQSWSMSAAYKDSPFITNEYARTLSEETGQTLSAADQLAEVAPSLHADVAARSSTQVSVSGTAHAQATAVGVGSSTRTTAVDIGSTHEADPGLPDDAAQSASTAQIRHTLPAVASYESLSIASSGISEELKIEVAESSQEVSPRSSHLSMTQAPAQAASAQATAVASGPGHQAQATPEALVEADDVHLNFESPDVSPPMVSADRPCLQPDSVGVSSLPLLAFNIGKKDSEDKEQQHLAPDLLAYAEAAMTEVDAEADRHALISSQATRQAEAARTALMTHAEAVPEAAGHGQQADNIAADLFDELLTDAVQSMTTIGEIARAPACFVSDAVNWADLLLCMYTPYHRCPSCALHVPFMFSLPFQVALHWPRVRIAMLHAFECLSCMHTQSLYSHSHSRMWLLPLASSHSLHVAASCTWIPLTIISCWALTEGGILTVVRKFDFMQCQVFK